VGKNYAAHAAEFAASGFDSSTQSLTDAAEDNGLPIVFSKPPTSISPPGAIIPFYDDFGSSLD
jgi:2-keto-4-pentenoate hydratase/2-oxohepta-3-ene-1,7-dioic acid hydratase in catechol pathway